MVRSNQLGAAFGLLLSLAAMCLAIRGAPDEDSARPKVPRGAWTVMLYMAADCDLEACQVSNVESMLGVGSDRDVQVVLLLDRSAKGEADRPVDELAKQLPGTLQNLRNGGVKNVDADAHRGAEESGDDDPAYTNRPLANLGNWSGTKLLSVQRSRIRELADWGAVNTGDPVVLKRFVDTAMRQFPAQRYALILNGHGLGWSGACHDESHDDILTTPELRAVLSQTTRRDGPLELLGFDACLMANFEVFQSLAPFARVLVASEEMEPGEGWNYVTLLAKLQHRPQATGLELGQMIAETFREYFEQNDVEVLSAITLSVVEGEKVPPIGRAIDRLAEALRRQLAADPAACWLKLARCRARTVEFGRQESFEGAAHLDLVHLCQLLTKEFPAGAVQEACDQISAAVQDAVVGNVHSDENPNSHGMTIFFPANRDVLQDDIDVGYETIEFSRHGAWFGWLRDYIGEAERHELQPLLRELRVSHNPISLGDQLTVTSALDADDFHEVYLALAIGRGANRKLFETSTHPDENLQLSDTWNGTWHSLEIGPQKVLCPVLNWREPPSAGKLPAGKSAAASDSAGKHLEVEMPAEPQPRIVEIPVQVCRPGSTAWHDVGLVFEFPPETPQGRFVEAFSRGRHGVRAFSLNRGDELWLLRGTLDAAGVRKLLPAADQPLLLVTDPRELRIGRQELSPGTYQIGYLVSNLANVFEEEFVDVKLDADKR